MRILLLGATGDVGQVAHGALAARHQVVTVGRGPGADFIADLCDRDSLAEMYAAARPVDAVVCCAGPVHFGPLEGMSEAEMRFGLTHKVLGQVNLVLEGLSHLTDGGSFTLTSGIVDRDPIRMGAAAATANGALGGFARSAAIEMPRGLRINVVSPGLLERSAPRYGAWFRGHAPVPDGDVGRAYLRAVDGAGTGQVICVD